MRMSGFKTFVFLALAGLVELARMAGASSEPVESFTAWLTANWESIAVMLGLIGAAWARYVARVRVFAPGSLQQRDSHTDSHAWMAIALGAVLLSVTFALSACASKPLSQQIGFAYSQVDAYTTRTDMLIDAKAISKAEAQRRLDLSREAYIAVASAEAALGVCQDPPDCLQARDRLAVAQVILDRLAIELIKRSEK